MSTPAVPDASGGIQPGQVDTSEQKLTHWTPAEIAQMKIVDALGRGSTVAAAAASAGVSRTTFYNWYKSDARFVAAIAAAQTEYARLVSERLNHLSQKAIARLDALLDSPRTPPAVTLKTALAILNRPGAPKDHWALPVPAEVAPLELPLPPTASGAPSSGSLPPAAANPVSSTV
jgi:AcrR family transcriptional regulator